MRSPAEAALVRRLRTDASTCDAAAATVPIRLHLTWSGTVQGVGFRWTNKNVADKRGLTGWVENQPDGSVEMEIQGTPDRIANHLDEVHRYYRAFGLRVHLDAARQQPVNASEHGFTVRG